MVTSRARIPAAVLAVLVTVMCVSACGSGDGLGSTGVAKVGNIVISRATLSHWMEAVAGGDYFEHVGKMAPRGLVSDPPNYNRCIAAAETMVPKTPSGQPGMTRQELATRCRNLNQALKEQTLSLLISIEGRVGEGAEQGIYASEADINAMFARVTKSQFPKEGEYQTYLAQRDWDQSIEMLQLKRNYISQKLQEKFMGKATGTKEEEEFFRYLVALKKKWKAKTTCRVGYIVPECKEYDPAHPSTLTAPSIQLEELAGVS